jgi:hypothetical protein
MKVLGLPGRNPETEAWLEALFAALGSPDAEVARYAHWQDGSDPDVAGEARRNPAGDAELVVVKSMGTMVLLAAVADGSLPGAAVLIGTPLAAYDEAQTEALRDLMHRIPCLFIQQTDDFTGGAAELREVLGESAAIEEVAGSDHVYADVMELAELIRAWEERHG